MTLSKRILDLFFAALLVVILGPVLLGLMCWLLIHEGRPIFYVSERMKGVDQPFRLWKLRTMTVVEADSGVSGGDKADRITPTGAWLRARRLDEFPQLWNILRGDLSFVGPRPPLREYVERYPDIYAQVLRSRPGVTGRRLSISGMKQIFWPDVTPPKKRTRPILASVCLPKRGLI